MSSKKKYDKLMKLGRKRQGFKALFAERFIPSCAICAVICILLAIILHNVMAMIYMENQNTHYDLTISAATQNMYYPGETEDKAVASQKYRNTLALQLYTSNIGSNVFKLYENNEEMLRTEKRGFAIIKDSRGDFICYSDPSSFEKAYEVAGKYIGKADPFTNEMVLTLADTIYADVDKGIFVPGKMHVERYEFSYSLAGTTNEPVGSTVEEFDITPADISGLTEYKKGQFVGGWVMGDDPANGRFAELDRIDNDQRAGGVISRSKNNSMTWQEGFTVNSWFRTNLNAPDGTMYTVTALYKGNFSGTYGNILAVICSLVFIICLVVSLIRAYRISVIYKAHYAMEDYRRDMTNTLAHDLKTPLMAISGCAEMLNENPSPEKQKHYSEMILTNVRYMDSMITNVLELSKIESSTELKRENFDIKRAAQDAADKYRIMADENNVTVKISGSGTVNADKLLMTQAVDNLIANAVKYASAGSTIEVSVSDNSFTVKNRYDGKNDKTADELFKPFVKGDSSRSGQNGSGLGLYIVKNICDKHGFESSLDTDKGTFTAIIKWK